jgi:hypothetical protein
MNDQETMSRQEAYERQAAAKRGIEEARTNLDAAQRRVGIRQAELRAVKGKRGNTAETGHLKADALREAAEGRFQGELRDYLAALRTNEPVPAQPPASLVATFVLARGGDELYAALHHAIDAAVDDPSTATFDVATEADAEEAIAAKQRELDEAREQVAECEAAVEQAQADYDDAT